MRKWLVVALACLAMWPVRAAVAPFVEGDRVCFLGDSITRGGSYHTLIEMAYAMRYPERHIAWFNCGVGGDTARAIVGAAPFRLEVDVFAHRPTVVTVMLGMNDVDNACYQPGADQQPDIATRRAERLTQYETAMKAIVRACGEHGARVILLTPSIYDEFAECQRPALPGRGAAVGKCAEIVRRLAADAKCELVDFHALMTSITDRERARDKAFSLIGLGATGNDRVHPGAVGHRVMAHAFLAEQGFGTGEPNLSPAAGIVPFVDPPNTKVYDLLVQRRDVGSKLRDLATSRYGLAKQGKNATDPKGYADLLAARPGNEALIKLLADEPALIARYDALSEEARAAAR